MDNGINVTMILYGQVAIGEYAVQTAEWRYYLGDAQLSVRQLVDESGVVTQAQTYGPYGVLLHQAGDGGGLFGYKGGQWFGRLTTGTAANGLWYFGDGYFDPNTGQFLATNGSPLLPLAAAAMANPAGLLLGPVLLINWRRRKGKKGVHPTTFLLLGILLAAGLASCGGGGDPTGTPGAPTLPPTDTPTPLPTVTVTAVATATSTATVVTIMPTPTITCTPETPTPAPFKTIFFGGSVGQTDNAGPAKGVQTTAWDDKIKDEDWYQYPGYPNQPEMEGLPFSAEHKRSGGLTGKNLQAWMALQRGYTGKLNVIGYSAGADAAQIFAGKFIEQGGQIHKMVLLGPPNDSIRDEERFPGRNWTTQADRDYFPNSYYIENLTKIVGTGTQVRSYNDNGWERIAITKSDIPHANYDYLPIIDKEHFGYVNYDVNFAQEVFAWLDE